ncbi:MAG: fibro-slime domain-containing protein, partial [Ruminococcus sp.]|nr:fibro-slime domain-containing protein [Ruminococcus sp.]
MAIFDEDFLSGNNSQGKQLATILHSPSFPVRKNDSVKAIYANAANVSFGTGEKLYAHFWKSATDSINVEGAKNGNVYSFTIPDGYTSVLFYKASSIGGSWSYKTKDITTIPTDTNIQAKLNNTTNNNVTWEAPSVTTTTHTYYEYDSTDGKDNAFITNINTTNKTAAIDYYANSAHYAESNSGTKGFFPFDYNSVLKRFTVNKVYLVPSDDWKSDNARFAAYFFDGGLSEPKWMSMSGSSGVYSCNIPNGATENTKVIFCRMNPNDSTNKWENKWNQTNNLECPFDTDVNKFALDSGYDNPSGTWSRNNGTGVTKYNSNSATAASHYAHDQGFGMKLEIPFTIGKNGLNDDGTAQQFNFSGDDDLWVFVDNNLVLDLGGAHGATTGSINFNTMTATANTAAKMNTTSGPTRNSSFGGSGATKWFDNTNPDKIHTMTIYYMERGMFDSNLKFGYSFHAIPNLLQVEKKVRTTSDDAYIKVNSGFFANNNQNGTASNMSDLYIDNGERQVTLFEKAFQADTFLITQNYPSTLPEGNTKLEYTIGEAKTEATNSDGKFNYTLHNNNDGDKIANFNGQINSGDSITLSETINDETNQFRYNPSIIVYDDASVVNGKSYQFTSGNGTDIGTYKANDDGSYTFNFKPSVPVTSGAIEDLRLRARFQNQMKCHDLTLKKVVNSGSPEDDFTFEIKFKFANSGSNEYIAYPLEINGTNAKLSNTGTVTLKAGESITMSGIPENAQVQIREIINNNTSYAYTSTTVTTETGEEVDGVTEVSTQDGVQFNMADENVDVEVKNATGEPVYISHSIHPESTGTGGTYVSVDVVQSNGTVRQSYARTNNVIKVDAQYITYSSTDTLRIVLDSYPDQYNEFMGFYEQISETMRELEAAGTNPTYTMTRSTVTGVYQATITINISDLFNAKHSQLYTELPFYSKFGKQLVITHKLDMDDPDTAALASATTKVRVEIYDNSGSELKASYPSADTSEYIDATKTIVIPPEYFTNDVYLVKVYLKTELSKTDFSQFNGFYIYDHQMVWPPDESISHMVQNIN